MHCKSYSHFFSKKFQHICVSLDVNFNKSLTNDIVSFEQLGPGLWKKNYLFSCSQLEPIFFLSFPPHINNIPDFNFDNVICCLIIPLYTSNLKQYCQGKNSELKSREIYLKKKKKKKSIFLLFLHENNCC